MNIYAIYAPEFSLESQFIENSLLLLKKRREERKIVLIHCNIVSLAFLCVFYSLLFLLLLFSC